MSIFSYIWVTHFHLLWYLSRRLLPTLLLLLLSFPYWFLYTMDVVFLLVTYIANIFSQFVAALFPLWSLLLKSNSYFMYNQIYPCSILFEFLYFRKSFPILKSFFPRSFKVGLFTCKSTIHQELGFVGYKTEIYPKERVNLDI